MICVLLDYQNPATCNSGAISWAMIKPLTRIELYQYDRLAGLIVHTTSWAFTMYQCRRARRQGRGKTPLILLLERDGTCFWLSCVGE
jgi:hypothetical protein